MIVVTQIIGYLRSKLQITSQDGNVSPAFRIDAAADIENALDDSRQMVDASGKTIPSLFVVLGTYTAKTTSTGTFEQQSDDRLIIIACIDNTQDRTGKYAQALVPTIRQVLFDCLLNKRIDPNCKPLAYVRDHMAKMDRARYWHYFEYSLIGVLQPADGADLDLTVFDGFSADFESQIPTADNPMAQATINNLFYQPGYIPPIPDNKE